MFVSDICSSRRDVRHLKGELSADNLLCLPDVMKSLQEVNAKFRSIDSAVLQQAVHQLFSENAPDYNQFKWQLGQNYYVAKTLGLDPAGRLLSNEVFKDATLFLDTNVMLDALEPEARHYGTFQALTKGCSDLDITLAACQVSIDELRKVVSFERELIEKLNGKIPDTTAKKVSGVLYPVYVKKMAEGTQCDFDELFSVFSEPSEMLKSFYGVEVQDSRWFIEILSDADFQNRVDVVQKAYSRPWRGKTRNAAIHDTLLLEWVEAERLTRNNKAWIVTLDYSLPSFHTEIGGTKTSLAITLDALIHWLSPISMGDEDKFADIFSEAIRHQVLPNEVLFDIRDFLVFAEMEWASKELPAEDIEQCIRYVKAKAPNLNPTDPKDREEISREIHKFFADPGRKFKAEISKSEEIIAQQENEIVAERKKSSDYRESAQSFKDQLEREKLRFTAFIRLLLVFALFIVMECGVVDVLFNFGSGSNLLQRIKNGWVFIALPVPVCIFVAWLYIGKEYLHALGFPFTKIFSVPEEN